MNDLLRDIKIGIYNQYRYGNPNPKYLICNPVIAEYINKFHHNFNVDDSGKAYVAGLLIVPRANVAEFYVR